MPDAFRRLFLVLPALSLVVNCRPTEKSTPRQVLSPQAQPEIVATLRADEAAPRHPADGGGRAWIEGTRRVTAGSKARFVIVYQAGSLGIAKDGMLFLQVSPFWGWSTPQVVEPNAAGYTKVTTGAAGVQLQSETGDQNLLVIHVSGRALAAGERIRIEYGAGSVGSDTDLYAEHGSRFWVAVDGDGDGVRKLIADSPSVDVGPGPAARMVAIWPSSARPGDSVRLTIALLDSRGNAGVSFNGVVRLHSTEGRLSIPSTVRLRPADSGRISLSVTVAEAGTYRIVAETESGLRALSGPLVVASDAPRVMWADLHGHSGLSDGTGTADDYLRYARDVAGLDAAALTDHDHWGMEPLFRTPSLWDATRKAVRTLDEPGRFVAILGYEWTSWLHGHRHVLYFDDDGPVLDSIDPRYETPTALWAALRGRPALTIAHHSAGGPIATNWGYPPDPVLEPVTEVASVHGSSEAADAPRLIYNFVSGNAVRDALDRGFRLGFVGGGDGHDGHPGLSALGAPSGGLSAIVSEELTRAGILEALRARRVYATNGPRIHLSLALDGHPMGSDVTATANESRLTVKMVSERPLARVDIVRSGTVAESVPGQGRLALDLERRYHDLRSGEYLYVRVVQEDLGAAWSSPFFVR